MRRILGISLLVLIFCATARADFVEERILSIPADGITDMKINCGAGYLRIEGIDGLDSIIVEAEIVIDGVSPKKAKQFLEDRLVLNLERDVHLAELDSWFESSRSLLGNFFSDGNRYINIYLRLPKTIALDIDDGSGSIWIENIDNNLRIDDGSGEMDIDHIAGDIDIEDGSGEMTLTDITGNIEIDDGSGDINVRGVKGSVVVSDGSGDINIDRVSEDVEIADDGSGDCRIRHVDGRVYNW